MTLGQSYFLTSTAHAALFAAAGVADSLAKQLAAGEADALALDFTDDFWYATTGQYGSAYVVDTGTPANDFDSIPYSKLTYTSPSVKMCRQSDGVLKYGAHNLVPNSENFAGATWFPNLATNSTGGFLESGSGEHTIYPSAGVSVGASTYIYTVEVQGVGRDWCALNAYDTLDRRVWFDLTGAGAVGTTAAGMTTTPTIAALGDGFYRLTYARTATTDLIYPAVASATADNTIIFAGDTAKGLNIRKAHVRRTPSIDTYLATTSAAKYELPYEWDSAGDPLGIRVEEARTELCLWNSDLTNAAWTASNVTTAKTAAGPDGVSNSATTLTATAGNGTVLQSITSASAARITSCWIKRRTGTGTINLTMDNGGTWTAVTVTSSWTMVEVPSATSTNPIIGVRIVTSGDAVDVAHFSNQLGAFTTSPIATTSATVTRAADSGIGILTSAYPHSATVNSAMIRYRPLGVASAMVALRWDDGTANEVVSVGHSAAAALGLTVTDGGAAQTAPLTDGTATAATWEKVAVSWKANDFLFSDNGAAAVADTSGTLPTVTSLDIGPALSGHISQILVVPVEKTAAEVATMATP